MKASMPTFMFPDGIAAEGDRNTKETKFAALMKAKLAIEVTEAGIEILVSAEPVKTCMPIDVSIEHWLRSNTVSDVQ
jgi:hypothetical protein